MLSVITYYYDRYLLLELMTQLLKPLERFLVEQVIFC